ncbi:putative ankyrin repeat protein [Dirofilaria immitis]
MPTSSEIVYVTHNFHSKITVANYRHPNCFTKSKRKAERRTLISFVKWLLINLALIPMHLNDHFPLIFFEGFSIYNFNDLHIATLTNNVEAIKNSCLLR